MNPQHLIWLTIGVTLMVLGLFFSHQEANQKGTARPSYTGAPSPGPDSEDAGSLDYF